MSINFLQGNHTSSKKSSCIIEAQAGGNKPGSECYLKPTQCPLSLSRWWRKPTFALAGVARWVGCCPANPKAAGMIPGQGTCLGCGFTPQSGCVWEATDQYFSLASMFLSLSLHSLPRSLKSISMPLGEDKNKRKKGKERKRTFQCLPQENQVCNKVSQDQTEMGVTETSAIAGVSWERWEEEDC